MPPISSEEAFAKRLNQALDLRNYPPLGHGRISYLQEIFALSRAGANKWLHGKVIPHKKKRIKIAETLGINLHWLETGEGDLLKTDLSRFEANQRAFEIPLLSLAAIYHLKEALQNQHALQKIIVSSQFHPNIFATKLVGLAMLPKLTENSILLVDPTQQPKDGDVILATTKTIPEAICRQYMNGSTSDYLIAINPKFDPILIDESVTIVGKVIEARTEL